MTRMSMFATVVGVYALAITIQMRAAQAPTTQVQAGQNKSAAAQSQSQPVILDATKPHDQFLTLDVVEVVGCFAEGPNKTYVLTDATMPVKTARASTTQAALDADKTKALGTQRYVIIGATEWNPASHKGQKVAVKGLMIKDTNETRLNVTSFQMVDSSCGKAKP